MSREIKWAVQDLYNYAQKTTLKIILEENYFQLLNIY